MTPVETQGIHSYRNASPAVTARDHWTLSSVVTPPTVTFTARAATPRASVPRATASDVEPDFCNAVTCK
jgi:hypothetical protein